MSDQNPPSNPNPNITLLDENLIFQRSFDGDNDAIRVEQVGVTSSTFSLSSTSGDSVIAFAPSFSSKSSVSASNSGTILAPISIAGMNEFQLYTNTTSNISVSQICTLQVSPSDTDNVWFSTSLTIMPSTTTGIVVSSIKSTQIIARRAQIIIAAPITGGSFDIYLMEQAN